MRIDTTSSSCVYKNEYDGWVAFMMRLFQMTRAKKVCTVENNSLRFTQPENVDWCVFILSKVFFVE